MDWGYVSGILDGEGSVMIKYHKNREGISQFSPMIAIVNTSYEMLKAVQEFIGCGHIFIKKNDTPSAIAFGKYHMRTYWRLQVASIPEVEYVLKNCLPHLIIKKGRAESALSYCEYRISNSTRLKSITPLRITK
jgi:hypothetical protein